MSTFISKFQEWKLKRTRIKILLHELYNMEVEVAYSVSLIAVKKEQLERYKVAMADLEAELPQGEAKLAPDAQKQYAVIQKEIAGFRFMVNATELALKRLYEEISQKGHNIKAIKNSVEFNRGLRLSNIPQLPYIEINGTKYQAKDNAPVHDQNDVMMLYMAPQKDGAIQESEK